MHQADRFIKKAKLKNFNKFEEVASNFKKFKEDKFSYKCPLNKTSLVNIYYLLFFKVEFYKTLD